MKDGTLRRASIGVHERLRAEDEARRAGLRPVGWKGGKIVVRVKAEARS